MSILLVLSSTEYFWYSRVLSCAINKNWKFFCWCFRGFPSSFWFLLTSHYLLPWLENKSPADGKGTGFGNLDRSGRFSKCDWSSLLTAVTFSSFDWYSWKRKTRCLSWSGMTVKERELLLGDELKKRYTISWGTRDSLSNYFSVTPKCIKNHMQASKWS